MAASAKTASSSRPLKQQRKRIYRRSLVVFIFILLITTGSLFALRVYQAHSVAADKKRFLQAEKDIDAVTADIITAAGRPAQIDMTKSCSRPHWELNNGPLSCAIETKLFYPVNDITIANNTYKKISSAASSEWSRNSVRTENTVNNQTVFSLINKTNESMGSYQRIQEDFTTSLSGVSCHLTTTFYFSTSPPSIDYARLSSPYTTMARLRCDGYAKAAYYPMTP